MHVSHKWLHQIDACAGSVLTPHDYITKRADETWQQSVDRLWAVPLMRLLLGPTAGTRRNLQHRRSHERTLRMRSPRGLRQKLQTQASLRNPGGAQLRNPGRLIFSPPLPSQDAVRPWMCVWPPLMQQQHEGTRCRRHSIVSWRTTRMKSENLDNRTFTTARLSGQRMGGRILPSLDHFSTHQTWPPVATGNISRRSPVIVDGSTKSKSLSCRGGQPWLAQFSQTPLRGQSGSSQASLTEPCITGVVSQPLTGAWGARP